MELLLQYKVFKENYFQRKFEQFNARGRQWCFKERFWGDNVEVNYLRQLLKKGLGNKGNSYCTLFVEGSICQTTLVHRIWSMLLFLAGKMQVIIL